MFGRPVDALAMYEFPDWSSSSDEMNENKVKRIRLVPGKPMEAKYVGKYKMPRRAPSFVLPQKQVDYPSPDRTTCFYCTCFPREDAYVKNKKLTPCQLSPKSLYVLAGVAVDKLRFPPAFLWGVDKVAKWMEEEVQLPQYTSCIIKNNINGRRLLLLEDPSHSPMMNIRDMNDIKKIVTAIHDLYSTEFIKFCRSIGLPPRYPLTHCTIFKSRTGPSWGIRENWNRTDVMRWMKILMPEPVYLDHWDLVWYQKPDFPKTMFARIPKVETEPMPRYKPPKESVCREYKAKRKFKAQVGIGDEIWMQHRPGSPQDTEREKLKTWLKEEKRRRKGLKVYRPTIPKPNRLDPPKVNLKGLKGMDLLLARRRLPNKKFLVM